MRTEGTPLIEFAPDKLRPRYASTCDCGIRWLLVMLRLTHWSLQDVLQHWRANRKQELCRQDNNAGRNNRLRQSHHENVPLDVACERSEHSFCTFRMSLSCFIYDLSIICGVLFCLVQTALTLQHRDLQERIQEFVEGGGRILKLRPKALLTGSENMPYSRKILRR